jgi:hypothetical protein
MALNTPLEAGETVVRESRANMQRGIESVGGHLYLTDKRLIFESHKLNVQRGASEIPLASVESVAPAWTRFLGFIPLAKNSVAVGAGGAESRFVVPKRNEWVDAIDRQRGGAA